MVLSSMRIWFMTMRSWWGMLPNLPFSASRTSFLSSSARISFQLPPCAAMAFARYFLIAEALEASMAFRMSLRTFLKSNLLWRLMIISMNFLSIAAGIPNRMFPAPAVRAPKASALGLGTRGTDMSM